MTVSNTNLVGIQLLLIEATIKQLGVKHFMKSTIVAVDGLTLNILKAHLISAEKLSNVQSTNVF